MKAGMVHSWWKTGDLPPNRTPNGSLLLSSSALNIMFCIRLSYHFCNSSHVASFISMTLPDPIQPESYKMSLSNNRHLWIRECLHVLRQGVVTLTVTLTCHWTWVILCVLCVLSMTLNVWFVYPTSLWPTLTSLSDVVWLYFLVFITLTYWCFHYIYFMHISFVVFQLEWF